MSSADTDRPQFTADGAEAEEAAEQAKASAEAAAKAEEEAKAAADAEAAAKAAEEAKAAPEAAVVLEANGAAPESTPLEAADKRLRELLPGVKDVSVLTVLAELADSDALERLVQKGKPPPKANFVVRTSLKNNSFVANETMSKAHDSQTAAKSLTKNYGLVDAKSLAVGGAGQGGGLGLNRPGSGPKVQHFAGGGRASLNGTKSINVAADVGNAWSEMMDDKSDVGWVVAGYTEDSKAITLQHKGSGGLEAFKAKLSDSICWGGFRCYGVDKRGGLECKRPKFVFVQYKPEAASQIKKARTASHKGEMKDAFTGAHIDVIVEKMEDLEDEVLIKRLQAATGAHKPNGYEFEEGVFVEADFYGLGIGKSCKGENSKN